MQRQVKPLSVPEIIVVGLGPGTIGQLTLEAWDILRAAPEIYLRTARHPTVAALHEKIVASGTPAPIFHTFDDVYEHAASFDDVYQTICQRLLDRAVQNTGHEIIYAVPGHPQVGERVTRLLRDHAGERGVSLHIVDGLSFLEPVLGAIDQDIMSTDQGSGFTILDATALAPDNPGWNGQTVDAPAGASPPSSRLLDTGRPLLIAQIYNVSVASATKIWLLDRYPAEHPCILLHASGIPGESSVRRDMPLAEIDHHSQLIDHLTTLYVPPLAPLDDLRSPLTLASIVDRLRAPNGCPWDREQTHATIMPQLIEECYEVLDAVENEDWDNLAEELGDLLLHVTMHAQFAEEDGTFNLGDVAQSINAKMVRRHPHVFANVHAPTTGHVLQNWEQIKKQEKAALRQSNGHSMTAAPEAPPSAIDGVPRHLPALAQAQKISKKAANLGFEWPDLNAVYAKLAEELAELRAATSPDEQRDELGDLLFVIVNISRHLHLDAEEALRLAIRKFSDRFRRVEEISRSRKLDLTSLAPVEIDTLWETAKIREGHRERTQDPPVTLSGGDAGYAVDQPITQAAVRS